MLRNTTGYRVGRESLIAALAIHPFVKDLSHIHIAALSECASECSFPGGHYLWRQGEQADRCYLIRNGVVALEISVPHHGPLHIETAGEGEVLCWSWLSPSYRWDFDARALGPVEALVLDGRMLREKCERDHSLGYALLLRYTPVLAARLQANRLRILDAYGITGPPEA